ncbi:MAG: GAF domain-containing protein [Desulfobacteraceae bacterium]|nr:GAF domain-containing protein [Desulfobacteraceae bacterium]
MSDVDLAKLNDSKKSAATAHDDLVAMAAFFQRDFSIDWLVELTGLKVTRILSILEGEVENGKMTNRGAGIYALNGDGGQQRLKKRFSPKERQALHREIVDLLLREYPEEEAKTQVLAHHLLHTENDIKGCRCLVRAGDLYLKEYKNEEAFQCYDKVLLDLDALQGKDACILYADTAVKYSKVCTAKHDTQKNLEKLHQGLARAKKWDHRKCSALLQMHIAKFEWLRSDYAKALEHYESGWRLANELGDPALIRSATTFSSFFLYWQGRFTEAIKSFEKVVPDVDNIPMGQFPLLAAITVGYCYYNTGQVTQGLGMFDVIRNHCLERGDLDLASYAAGNIGSIMLDLRRVDDALEHLKHADREAKAIRNDWVYMNTRIMFAFAYYLQNRKDRCLAYLKEYLEISRKWQISQTPYPYLMVLLWAMEEGELPRLEGVSLEEEIESKLRDTNIFMKGIAYRYQALLNKKRGKPVVQVMSCLGRSIKYLKQSGHKFALARSRIELARVHLMLDNTDKAKKLIRRAHEVVAPYNEEIVPDALRSLVMDHHPRNDAFLKKILKIGTEIFYIANDINLVKKVITTVNKMTGAERGALFLLDERGKRPRLRLRASKNITPAQIEHPDFASSMAMIEGVVKTGKGIIKENDGEEDANFFSNETIRSRICVPLVLLNRVVGALYHDNRILSAAFQESDMAILDYFAALATFALDNSRAYAEIKRLNAKLSKEKAYYKEEHDKSINSDDIIGKSRPVKKVLSQAEQVAATESTVLVLGETGVGKELVATAIHRQSPRREKPFVKVNCSALSEDLIASELFGHEKGAFSGAIGRRIGRFELADGGTLFLDEIGEISQDLQVRLLRVLQTHEFERVGGNTTLYSDFRLIAATNKNLDKEVNQGRFRADLYYRLNVFPIVMAPLRKRKEDIPLLAYHFLNLYSSRMGSQFDGIPESEMEKLIKYDWPGNVRELENIMERGAILSREPVFRVPQLASEEEEGRTASSGVTLKENERNHILWALEKTHGKIRGKGGAAELLEINPSTLHFRMKKLGIK